MNEPTFIYLFFVIMQWAEMLEKEFAGALAINSELEAAKKAISENLLKTTSTVCAKNIDLPRLQRTCFISKQTS